MTGGWEPLIVTMLRRSWRRGASPALLLRLAGGPAAWQLLNEWWNIDGTRPPSPLPDEDVPAPDDLYLDAPLALSAAERRIALAQIAGELAECDRPLPTLTRLGHYFGVTRSQIDYDLEALRNRGTIDWELVSDGRNGVRRQPLRIVGTADAP